MKRGWLMALLLAAGGTMMAAPSGDAKNTEKGKDIMEKQTSDEFRTVLAPVAPYDQGAPQINGPEVYGASPERDLLYLVPVVGERPLSFRAEGLPPGLELDKTTGILRGRAAAGRYAVKLRVENRLGAAERGLTLVIEENALALTPPLGWNSWNCYRSDIDEAKIRAIAAAMVESGLAARGYSYVNLDSGWQSKERGGPFNAIVPHEGFPDMKRMCDYLHSLGLKAGIYSSPYVNPWGTKGRGCTDGPCDTTVPLYKDRIVGLKKYEAEDARQWAAWGFDYLKYDWVAVDMLHTERMSRALRESGRDLVLSLATRLNIANAPVAVGWAQAFRSNGDTSPIWRSIAENGFGNDAWNPWIGPGHWFDLDMLATQARDGQSLTEDELVTHITCWMIRPTPILIDCDPRRMSETLKRLLCNEEVLAVNQDALGLPSVNICREEGREIRVKPLADGSLAVGFFNLGDEPALVREDNLKNHIGKRFRVRDLWARRDLGLCEGDFSAAVAPHGAKLYRIRREE